MGRIRKRTIYTKTDKMKIFEQILATKNEHPAQKHI